MGIERLRETRSCEQRAENEISAWPKSCKVSGSFRSRNGQRRQFWPTCHRETELNCMALPRGVGALGGDESTQLSHSTWPALLGTNGGGDTKPRGNTCCHPHAESWQGSHGFQSAWRHHPMSQAAVRSPGASCPPSSC